MTDLFESSTCFEQPCAHPQEDNCINTTSGINTLSWWPSGQVGYLLELYEDARCEKYTTL